MTGVAYVPLLRYDDDNVVTALIIAASEAGKLASYRRQVYYEAVTVNVAVSDYRNVCVFGVADDVAGADNMESTAWYGAGAFIDSGD